MTIKSLINQRRCKVSAPTRPTFQSLGIEFSRIAPALFFGFTYLDRFYMASPEKAILDTLYYRKVIPAQDELELDNVDFNLLSKMASGYPPSIFRSLRDLSDLGH
jgi:hypothetical protein